MARYTDDVPRRGLLSNVRKLLLFLLVFGVAIFIMLRLLGFQGNSNRNYTTIPKEMQLTFQAADFEPNIDEENALAVLSNPERYQKEFDQLVYEFNMSLISHVANRMGIMEQLGPELRKEYKKHHDYIRGMYFNDFVALQDTTSRAYKTWYGTELLDAVDYLNEVASKYTCTMINLVITTVLQTQEGKIAGIGNRVETPCGIALTEGLRPMIERLQERAAIEDFTRAKGMIGQRVERNIAELATMEIEDTKALSRKLQTKALGYNISTTDIEISAMCLIKVGFNLNKYFDLGVNPNRKLVTITLPEPEILSLDVYPRIDKMDIGWMREVESNDLNRDFKLLADAFRADAMESDVFSKSKEQAAVLIETMLGPLVSSLGRQYKLRIQFKEENRLDF